MTEKEKTLISKLWSATTININGYHKPTSPKKFEKAKLQFLKDFTVDITKNPEYLIQLLEIAHKEKADQHDVTNVLYIASTFKVLSEEFVDILITLLQETWHYGHESIVWALQEIKSPRTVDILYETAIVKVPYLDYDDTGHNSLRLHCIWALGEINTPEAKEKLKLLAQSDIPILKEKATYVLRNGNIGPML